MGLLDQRFMNAALLGQQQRRGLLSQQYEHKPANKKQWNEILPALALGTSQIPIMGDIAGIVSDANMYYTKPEDRNWSNYGLSALGLLPFVGSVGSVKGVKKLIDDLPMDEASRMKRMENMGMTRGYYRGGANVADGNYYTPDMQAATDFAQRHPSPDVREYALRFGNQFKASNSYSPEELIPIAKEMEKYGVKKKMIDEFLDMPNDYEGGRMPGGVVQFLTNKLTGDWENIFNKVYDSSDFGQEVVMFNRASGGVRDANLAKFDPKKKFDPSPFAGVAGLGILGGLYGSQEE